MRVAKGTIWWFLCNQTPSVDWAQKCSHWYEILGLIASKFYLKTLPSWYLHLESSCPKTLHQRETFIILLHAVLYFISLNCSHFIELLTRCHVLRFPFHGYMYVPLFLNRHSSSHCLLPSQFLSCRLLRSLLWGRSWCTHITPTISHIWVVVMLSMIDGQNTDSNFENSHLLPSLSQSWHLISF